MTKPKRIGFITAHTAADNHVRRWQTKSGCNCARLCPAESTLRVHVGREFLWCASQFVTICRRLRHTLLLLLQLETTAPHQSVMTSALTHYIMTPARCCNAYQCASTTSACIYYSALRIADYSYVCMSTPWVNSETPYSCPSLQQLLTEFIPLLSFNANFSQFAWNARINGLGWPWTAERTFREKMCFVEPTRKNWMKIDPYYQRQKYRSMILLSRNIGFF